jgi:HEAT repeat protein
VIRLRLVFVCAFVPIWLLSSLAATAPTQPATDAVFDFGCVDSDIPRIIEINATPPRVVQLLSHALSAHPSAPRRVELVRDLGLCKRSDALPSVLAAMSDPEASVRAEAAQSAALIGDNAAARSGLQKLLSDGDPAVRREVVVAAASMNDPAFITAGLKDPDDSVFAAACALATTPQHDALIAARLPSASLLGRLAAIRALGRRRAGAYASLVASQLSSGDLSLTIAAVRSLGQMKATSQRDRIKMLLSHEHPTVRRVAVAALSKLAAADEQITIARRMLKDPDLSVREAAAELFMAHPSADDVPSLFRQLSTNYGPLHDSARDALVAAALAPIPTVVDSAAKLLTDADPNRREDGSYILGRARSDAALEQHIRLLNDENWAVVRQAAESLGRIGRPEAASSLAQLAAKIETPDDSEMTDGRLAAIECAFISCGQLRYKPILPLAQRLMPQKTVYPSALRASAIWAAGLVGEANDSRLASIFLSISNDNGPFESEDARFEAIKAIGNLHYLPALNEMRRQSKESPFPKLRWMAHLVADRLAGGTPTTYTPPSVAVVAETSIRSLGQ